MQAIRPTLLLTLAFALTACGGGGSASPPAGTPPDPAPPAPPAIHRFEASATLAYVGDTVRIRADFTGGLGHIEPDVGAVISGSEILVGPLDRNRTLRLVVSQPGQTDAVRDLDLRVGFRNRYLASDVRLAASHHSAVLTADGDVLVIGGSRGEGVLSSQIDRYDPRTHTVTPLGQLSQGRAQATATRLDDGLILVAGGEFSGNDWRLAELVNERTGSVLPAGRMSVTRTGHASLALPGGKVLVTGGVTTGESAPLGLSRSAEIWDPATRSFRRLAHGMLEARSNHTMSLLPDGRVLIVGGFSHGAQPLFAEVFDPRAETFSSLFVWHRPRAEHAAFTQADGRVLIVGGEQPQEGQEDWTPTASVLRFDPATDRFTELPPLAAPRSWVRGVLTPDGEVLLFGGRQVNAQHSRTAERYDPRSGGVPIADLDGERASHRVLRLPSGRIAIVGGESRSGHFASTLRVYE